MSNVDLSELSEFGRSALKLDLDFLELDRLSGQMERLVIESESDLDRAKQVLSKFAEYGTQIAQGVQEMAKALEGSRMRAESAAKLVAQRALEVQASQERLELLLAKFKSLGEMVYNANSEIAQLGKPAGVALSAEERVLVTGRLPELEAKLGALADEAGTLTREARDANMKALARKADSLGQTLQSARRKLGALAPKPSLH